MQKLYLYLSVACVAVCVAASVVVGTSDADNHPRLVSGADKYVIPPDSSVDATVTAVGLAEDASIAFQWIEVAAEGPAVGIAELAEGAVLTLTAWGYGTATVEVRATDGATTVADTIEFIQPSLMLSSDAEDNQVLIPHHGSATVTVTADGSLPTGATVAFTWTPEDAVTVTESEDSDSVTLTSSSAATVTVSASAADGKITADPITIQFAEPQPRLVSDVGDEVVIPLADSVVATITAIDFPDGDVQFTLTKDVDESITIEQTIGPREVVLTAQGSGSATVVVTASSGEGENMITASYAIRFDHARLVSDSDADKYVIPPDSSVVATVTAVGFPKGATIAFNWIAVDTEGPEVTIAELAEGADLTLTASGSGEVTVMVQGTGGGITREITIQFSQPLSPDPPDPPDLSVDRRVSDEIVSLPRGGIPATVRVTAENFPADAEITFSVESIGNATVEHSQDGAVLTLEVTGPGAAIVTVTATDGKITADPITIRFIQPIAAQPNADFDGDGTVGFSDFLAFAGQFGARRGDGTYQAKFDLNSDGAIDFDDFLLFVNSYGQSMPAGSGGGGSSSRPDLIVESSVSASTLTSGQSFTLQATVRNRGTWQSTTTTLHYYQSSDATITPSDTEVGTASVSGVSALGTSAESISLTAPARAGTYYYGACVVAVVGESNTTNNCSVAVRVTVSSGGVGAPKMYWTDYGSGGYKIPRANLDGSNVEDLITGLSSPFGIALDVGRGKMYWTHSFPAKIQRANLDGSNVEDLITGLSNPYGIALDWGRGKMYWTDYYTNKIQRANLDGSNVEDLITTGLIWPAGIALDVGRGKMYWIDRVPAKIQRANLDGSNVEDLITTGLSNPISIALDVERGKMYWTDTGTAKIQRANLDGSQAEDLVTTGVTAPSSIALDLGRGKIYWTDGDADKIQRANLDGSNVEDLITTGPTPRCIALDLRGR